MQNAKELKNNAWLFLKMVLFPFAAALLLEMLVFNFSCLYARYPARESRGIAPPEETDLKRRYGFGRCRSSAMTEELSQSGTSERQFLTSVLRRTEIQLLNVTIQVTDESNSASPWLLYALKFFLCTDTASSLSLLRCLYRKSKDPCP